MTKNETQKLVKLLFLQQRDSVVVEANNEEVSCTLYGGRCQLEEFCLTGILNGKMVKIRSEMQDNSESVKLEFLPNGTVAICSRSRNNQMEEYVGVQRDQFGTLTFALLGFDEENEYLFFFDSRMKKHQVINLVRKFDPRRDDKLSLLFEVFVEYICIDKKEEYDAAE